MRHRACPSGPARSVPNVDVVGNQRPLHPAGPDDGIDGRPTVDPATVEVRRSHRRRRTVSAYRDGDRTIVMIPARMSRGEEREWVGVMLRRLEAQDRRRRPSDAALRSRARRLSADHLGGQARPSSVRWVTNQSSRWGSCTPDDATIRLSDRLQGMPSWVIDYVLVHELTHLVEATHSARFWSLVDAYPRAERARGYLEGIAAASAVDGHLPFEGVEAAGPTAPTDSCLGPDDWDRPSPASDGTVGPSGRR